jgi:hypothetical protein
MKLNLKLLSKKKFLFFIFRYKFRKLALNNLIKVKKIDNYYLINLSGPYLYWAGYLIYKLNIFKNFYFISCDGWPNLNKKNSINIWFGGTILKVPATLSSQKNNYVTASNIFTKSQKLIQFYPLKVPEIKELKEKKIIIAMTYKKVSDDISLDIWKNKKELILKNLSILESPEFWDIEMIKNLNVNKKHLVYVNLKSLLRIELIRIIKENFKEKCILIGDDLKKIYPDALRSKFEENFLKKYYEGNICLDFLAKDGDQILYPRSIEIIESGGIIIQIKTNESLKIYENFVNEISFNNKEEMINVIKKSLLSSNLSDINKFFQSKFNKQDLNLIPLQRFFE